MDIYVCGGDFKNEVCELCENLIIPKNIKRKHLLDYGFTNFNAPYYYKVWGIIESDKYPVSFAMTIKNLLICLMRILCSLIHAVKKNLIR